MPEISEEQLKKYHELLEKEKAEKIQGKVDREIYIDQLSKRVKGLLDLNKTYGNQEAYARTFAKFLNGDMEAHQTNTLFFDWVEIQGYLTKVCLEMIKGNINLNGNFRRRLKELGYTCKIDNRWNVFTVRKCQPTKIIR